MIKLNIHNVMNEAICYVILIITKQIEGACQYNPTAGTGLKWFKIGIMHL